MQIVKRVIVYTRTRTPVSMIKGRDVWWEDEIKKVETMDKQIAPAEEMDAEDPCLFYILQALPVNPKVWCILVPVIWSGPITLL